ATSVGMNGPQEVGRLTNAAREIVHDIDDWRPPCTGGHGDVTEPQPPRVFDRESPTKPHTAIHAKRVTTGKSQVKQCEKILVPANRDAVFGNTAESLENAVIKRPANPGPGIQRSQRLDDNSNQPRS